MLHFPLVPTALGRWCSVPLSQYSQRWADNIFYYLLHIQSTMGQRFSVPILYATTIEPMIFSVPPLCTNIIERLIVYNSPNTTNTEPLIFYSRDGSEQRHQLFCIRCLNLTDVWYISLVKSPNALHISLDSPSQWDSSAYSYRVNNNGINVLS